jgi:hypothetical protein
MDILHELFGLQFATTVKSIDVLTTSKKAKPRLYGRWLGCEAASKFGLLLEH